MLIFQCGCDCYNEAVGTVIADINYRVSSGARAHIPTITPTPAPTSTPTAAPSAAPTREPCEDDDDNAPCYMPILTIQGNKSFVHEAGTTWNYKDRGCKCNSYVDGEIDRKVYITGDLVKTDIPGTYTIDYACTDSAGKSARTDRTVTITKIVPTPPPTPAPTPPPTPASPTPAPAPTPNPCPGGNLVNCIGTCPKTPPEDYKSCVGGCVTGCG